MPAEIELACECGYVARARDIDDLVVAARRHAHDEHGIELPPELVVALAERAAGAKAAKGTVSRLRGQG